MRMGGIHPEAGADGPRRGALCQAEAMNTSPKTQSGKAVTGTPSYSQWIPWIANTTSSVLFLKKNCRWFTTCLNKIIYNLAVLFVEPKDHFKSSSDWVPDHLCDRNLVWTQLSFPTSLGIIKDMEALPFGQRGIQEEHTQVKAISPAVSTRQPCRSSNHPPSRDIWTSLAFQWRDESTLRAFWSDAEAHAPDLSALIQKKYFQF